MDRKRRNQIIAGLAIVLGGLLGFGVIASWLAWGTIAAIALGVFLVDRRANNAAR